MGGAAGSGVLRACSQHERDGPVIINTAPSRYFKKKQKNFEEDDGWDSDGAEEEPDSFEHFMLEAKGSRLQALKQKKKKKVLSGGEGSSLKFKEKSSGFDHESTFIEDREKRTTKQSKLRSRNSDGMNQGSLLLIKAIRDGESEDVARLLRDAPDTINEKDDYGQTPLFFATSTGNVELVIAMLDNKAEVECANKYGYTPLMRALAHGFVAIAAELTRGHADVDAKDHRRDSVLQVVARSGQVESAEWLLRQDAGAEQVNLHNDEGHTPLLTAVRSGNPVICHRLLSAKANPNLADVQGRTPILHALASNDLDLAVQLISSRADVNAEDEDGRSVLMSLVVNLLRHPEQRQSGMSGIAAALEARASVEAEDKNGCTPLIVGARQGEAMLCAILIAYGASASVVDDKDRTPLVIARTKGFSDVAKVLTEFGETRTVQSKYFDRLLLRAVYYGNSTATKALLDRGADISHTTKDGTELKSMASRLGHSGTLKVLKEAHKADRPAGSSKNNADTAKRKEALQVWLKELREGAQHASQLQVHCRNKDVDGILGLIDKMTQAPPSTDGMTFSADLIAKFVRDRLEIILRQVRQDLRVIRTAIRQQLIQKFGEDLLKWDRGTQGDEHELQKIMALGVNNVRGIKLSEFEASDHYTERLEDIQIKSIDPVLRLAYEIPSLYAEEVHAKKRFPADGEQRYIAPLQCPKCMLAYGNSKALKEHVKYCQSRVGEMEEEKFRKARLDVAESAINILEGTAHRYRAKGTNCQSIAQTVTSQRTSYRKSLPEAMPVLVGCSAFVEIVENVCWHREAQCMRAASEQSAKWGLNLTESSEDDVTRSLVCRACLVKQTSRMVQHRDGTRPCAVLCSACSFELGMKLKAGKDAICPGCHKLMSGTALLT